MLNNFRCYAEYCRNEKFNDKFELASHILEHNDQAHLLYRQMAINIVNHQLDNHLTVTQRLQTIASQVNEVKQNAN